MSGSEAPQLPLLVLAADHHARGVVTIERYDEYLRALTVSLPYCDGILASAQPLHDLAASGAVEARHRTYLSINRTGLAGSCFELDDRLVATVAGARQDGWSGVKHMTRIDWNDPLTAPALELLGRVIEEARSTGLEALIEAVAWHEGAMDHRTDAIVKAAVIAHDLGAPLLKVAMPAETPGRARVDAVARVVASVGVPVLFLGGPNRGRDRSAVLGDVRDVMAGGAAGLAIGRTVYQDAEPASLAKEIAEAIHGS